MSALDDPGLKRGLHLAPFDELADPGVLVELAVRAEARGWGGLFLWDHIVYRPPVRAVADPWVALSAIAARTSRLRLGPLVTPLSRRRVQKVARETVTLDRLSGGRLTLGVGLGNAYELAPFGEEEDPRFAGIGAGLSTGPRTRAHKMWARAPDLGVDGIMSDCLRLLRDVYTARGLTLAG